MVSFFTTAGRFKYESRLDHRRRPVHRDGAGGQGARRRDRGAGLGGGARPARRRGRARTAQRGLLEVATSLGRNASPGSAPPRAGCAVGSQALGLRRRERATRSDRRRWVCTAASGLRGRIGSGGCGSLGRQSCRDGSDRNTPPQRLTRQPGASGVAGPVPGCHACCRAGRSGAAQDRHAPSARRVRSGRSALRRLRRPAEGDAARGPGGSASESPGAAGRKGAPNRWAEAGAGRRGYQPHARPAFCCSSHPRSGAKYSSMAPASAFLVPVRVA